MRQATQAEPHKADCSVQVKIGDPRDCWRTLAALIAKKADEIYLRRAETGEEGLDAWQLAQLQIEKPLCCGLLRLTRGWLISFSSGELASAEIEICPEPNRLIIISRNPPTGAAGGKCPAVRVLKLPNEINSQSVSVRCQGPIIDVELRDRATTTMQAAAAA
jgi:hypothetical protein